MGDVNHVNMTLPDALVLRLTPSCKEHPTEPRRVCSTLSFISERLAMAPVAVPLVRSVGWSSPAALCVWEEGCGMREGLD